VPISDEAFSVSSRLRKRLGSRYAIERLIGEGGMATVFLARDRKHADRPVALKVLREEVSDRLGSEQFLSEIRIAALLNHPHIVPMFDSGEQDGLLYYVMPYVEGQTLRVRLRRGPQPDVAEILRIAKDVLSALGYAHGRGVVHRDIKPENIMLAGNEAMLMDFGIAVALRATGKSASEAGPVLGTPGYMSPEQALGLPDVDARSDLYSTGCVLYEMVAGEPISSWLEPGAGRLGARVDATASAVSRLDALPRDVECAIARSLAVSPADRFNSAAEFSAALQGAWVPGTTDVPSIAVLPLVGLSLHPEDAFLGEGLAEEITNALTRIGSLRVAARTSAFAYKDTRLDVRQIGRELGVSAVLEGSVRHSGDLLRIAVQLIDVADGYHLWSAMYERPMRHVFAVQDEITRHVVQALQVILTESERHALARVPTTDPTAYEYYLRGRQLFHEVRKKSLEYAQELFGHAIEADPGFALAHAGIADCISLLHMYYPSATPELARADAASRRALELDPDLPEAHAARGFALFQMKQHEEAAAEFQTAIRLDPNQFEARYFHARQCFQLGQLTEAARWFEEAARVQENHEARFFAAQALEAEGHHEEALASYRKALEVVVRHQRLHPDDPRAATIRAVSHCRLGEPEAGLEWARRALAIDPGDAGVRYNVACLYALEGLHAEAVKCLAECVRLGFGNVEWIRRDPDLASLHGHPLFEALVGSDAGDAPRAAATG